MAGRIAAKVASLALLFAAPLVQASNGTARSCALCWETASNQAITPFCTGISGDAAKAECLCSAGNKAIFDTCEKACAGLDRAPSNVCPKVAARANDDTCGTCWNAETAKRCPGISNSFEQQLCLCSAKNAGDFINKCESACANSIVKPSDACHVPHKRADDNTCAACWNGEIAERCPGLTTGFEQQLCLCDPFNRADFIGKCDSACANSIVKPSDSCRFLPKRESLAKSVKSSPRADDQACGACWNQELAEHCPGTFGLEQYHCICNSTNIGDFIGKCDPPCANSIVTPSQACQLPGVGSKRSAQGESILPWKHDDDDKKTSEKVHRPKPGYYDCFPLPGLACHNTAGEDAAQ
ncbi:hypothetical protein PRZ48_013450 [Zasmidium cellare]|uniref:Uncharacterized protein n=1 Tax=Zasmidium cellare TaxID=395010 RepID=A0ABR0E123_ZASCE|nr:hypothetical protein PRZ48_013450 [Zasmidium cellare]